MRRLAVELNIPFISTIQASEAAAQAIEESGSGELQVIPLQAFVTKKQPKKSKL